jgi:hypothetical protein
MLRRYLTAVIGTGLIAAAVAAGPGIAAPGDHVSGAIFTTDSSGVPVNLNHYANKRDVYLNGGPGINAPDDAAGLPDGTYTFMVTDPPGKTLLSTDPAQCRQFTVSGGVIQAYLVVPGCAPHVTGTDGEDGGKTIQLFPYDDTPNNGGVYKVWVTPTYDLDCNGNGAKFCFVPRFSKTDNFKVRDNRVVEIDVQFWRDGVSTPLLGMVATWIDTNGASNIKYSEYNPALLAFYQAHVEAAEQGNHKIVVSDQPGCAIDRVLYGGKTYFPQGGSVTVQVAVKNHSAGDASYFVDVLCAN